MFGLITFQLLLPVLLAQLAAMTIAFMDGGGAEPPQTDPYGGG